MNKVGIIPFRDVGRIKWDHVCKMTMLDMIYSEPLINESCWYHLIKAKKGFASNMHSNTCSDINILRTTCTTVV